jgi:glycerol kinase
VTPDAIGITNQRETVCAWERESGRPVHRAIVWQDRRTAAHCAQLEKQKKGALVRSRTGLVLDPYFSATKIEWLLEHVKGLPRRAADGDVVFGTIDTWLIFRLTNGKTFATDHTNASRTMLYDIQKRAWDRDLLKLFGVPRDALPDVRSSSGDFGTAAAEHFGAALPITGVAGDQQAALLGQGCWQPGQAKNTYGTGAFLLLNTGKRRANSKRGLLTTLACGPRGEPVFALEGSGLHRRRGDAVAARWTGNHREGCGIGADGAERRRHRWGIRPRVRGVGRAPLGAQRPRHDRRSHPRQQPRASRPPRARGDGVQHQGRPRRHDGRR